MYWVLEAVPIPHVQHLNCLWLPPKIIIPISSVLSISRLSFSSLLFLYFFLLFRQNLCSMESKRSLTLTFPSNTLFYLAGIKPQFLSRLLPIQELQLKSSIGIRQLGILSPKAQNSFQVIQNVFSLRFIPFHCATFFPVSSNHAQSLLHIHWKPRSQSSVIFHDLPTTQAISVSRLGLLISRNQNIYFPLSSILKKKKKSFQSNFMFLAQLRGRFRDYSYTLCANMQSLPQLSTFLIRMVDVLQLINLH